MEKKTYSKPVLSAQRFEPQEYCVPCGDGATEVTYYFVCDGGIANTYHDVYLETNGRPGLQQATLLNPWGGDDRIATTYHPCNRKHQVTVPLGTNIDDIFPYGYLIIEHQQGWTTTYETVNVRVWRGDDGRNCHVTTHLDQSSFTPHNPS